MWKGVMDLQFLKCEREERHRVERGHGQRRGRGKGPVADVADVEKAGQSEQEGHCRCMEPYEEPTHLVKKIAKKSNQTFIHSALGETVVDGDLGTGEERGQGE